ncbi:MAG: hypothetical protein M3Q47_00995 [Actinomycetota bacterium]|nr:hypothetical protein [Actinomycetota bacterium]
MGHTVFGLVPATVAAKAHRCFVVVPARRPRPFPADTSLEPTEAAMPRALSEQVVVLT